MTEELDRYAIAVQAIDDADRALSRAKKRLVRAGIAMGVLMAVAGTAGMRIASAYNYDIDTYDGFSSGRGRSGDIHDGVRNLHEWLESHVASEVVLVAIVILFIVAIGCFMSLPVLMLRWQRAKDAHADAVAKAEASLD